MGAGSERNEPCRCGSGKKFKKCCWDRDRHGRPSAPTVPPEVRAEWVRREHEEAGRRRRFGDIRSLITTTHQGYRFIAVGSRLYYNKNWRTFTDFLLFYIRDVMGNDWWTAEQANKGYERHPILKWHDRWVEASKTARREEGGIVSGIPDGLMSALMLLAYDLYVIRDHAKLQDEVVQRLRIRDQFQGARYELFVAATFVRAGFDFAYEDESDTKKKHAEFIATHKSSGLVVAVEAKARQRVVRAPFDITSIRPGVKQLLVSAAEKRPAQPLIVFLELSLPPEPADQPPSWVPEVDAVVVDIAQDNQGRSPFGAVLFTNRPHIYGQLDQPDPAKHYYAVWATSSPVPQAIIDALGEAAAQYGNVPSKFPDDFPRKQVDEGGGGNR